jgi:hypothetical protein
MRVVINALDGAELGPGVLYRTIAPIQRSYLSGERPRYPHRRRGRGAEQSADTD